VTAPQPGSDAQGQSPAQHLIGPLVEALLAARTQPSAEHFDQVLTSAVTAGQLPAELARELRYWQRASVHEITDHFRAVLPVLPAALAAVDAAAAEAAGAATAAGDVWAARPVDRAEPTSPEIHGTANSPDATEAVPSAPDVIVLPAAQDAQADTDVSPAVDTEHVRRRMFVAGLTSTA
jgi:hypothetical protein